MQTLKGERVVLRAPREDDVTRLVEVMKDPLIAKRTTAPQPYLPAHAYEWINRAGALEAPNAEWLVEVSGKVVGALALVGHDKVQHSIKTGYWAAPEARGKGIISEAARLAITYVFDNFDIEKVIWQAQAGNEQSWRLAWKLGFVFEGVVRNHHEPARVVDLWTASLLRGEEMAPACDPNLPLYFDLRDHSKEDPAKRPYDPRRPQELVRQFHEVYGLPVELGTTPTSDIERVHMRMSLISEEFEELTEAVYGSEAGAIIERAVEAARDADDHTRDTIETADALADLVYVIYGMALECGMDLDKVLAEVQASNLSKLGEDGKPIYREDGKVLKGPGFFHPNIARALGLESDVNE